MFADEYHSGDTISIHALLAESDTTYFDTSSIDDLISIHALLAESDAQIRDDAERAGHFYPRSPCGERPIISKDTVQIQRFLSTLSLRRATVTPQ